MVFFSASRNEVAEDQQISLQRGFFIKKKDKEEVCGLISRGMVFFRLQFKCQKEAMKLCAAKASKRVLRGNITVGFKNKGENRLST